MEDFIYDEVLGRFFSCRLAIYLSLASAKLSSPASDTGFSEAASRDILNRSDNVRIRSLFMVV